MGTWLFVHPAVNGALLRAGAGDGGEEEEWPPPP